MMALAYILGGGFIDGPSTGLDLYEQYPAVRALYEEVTDATGFTVEQITREELPDELALRWCLGEIRQGALQLALHDVLAEHGIRPAMVGGLSLGALTAAVMSGSLSRRELFGILSTKRDIRYPGPGDPEEGLALMSMPVDADPAAYLAGIDGVYPAIHFGPTNDGESRVTVIAGYQEAIAKAAADVPTGCVVTPLPNRPFAAHSPLWKHASDFLEPHVAAATFADPRIPVVNSLAPETITTGEGVRQMFRRNPAEPVSLAYLYEEMRRNGATLAFALGSGVPPAGILKLPFPVVYLETVDDLAEAFAAADEAGIERSVA